MTPEQEQKLLSSLYDRLYDAITYSPDGKSGAFPKNVYFQMAKNEVLNPDDFANMLGPVNPNGDQRSAEAYSAMVDRLPNPGPLWSDSGRRLSNVLGNFLAQANTNSQPNERQKEIYQKAYAFLNTTKVTKNFMDEEVEKTEPSNVAIAYDQARAAYIAAISGYRTAYNGYDLDKIADQRAWNAAAPSLQNLVEQTWNAWNRSGKAEVEQAQQALASTINDAVSYAIEQAKSLASDQYRLPSSTPNGPAWHPSYALPSNWASPGTSGIKLRLTSDNVNKTESSRGHTYGVEAAGRYGLFHAKGGVEGEHKETNRHMDAQKLTLEAELMVVNIMRPWFNPLLFDLAGWWVSGVGAGGLSNGDPNNPTGSIPLIPTGFVVARNVTIEADFSEEDERFVSHSVNSKVEAGWGPFSLSGKYGYSASDTEFTAKMSSGKLSFPGLQVLAWISTVTPSSPPLAPR